MGPNQIRAWRKSRPDLTLERLADRVRELGEPITATSLSRIERRLQPYTQRTLEAIAEALGREPADLVMRRPPSKAQIEVLSVIEGMPPEQQQRAVAVLKAMVA